MATNTKANTKAVLGKVLQEFVKKHPFGVTGAGLAAAGGGAALAGHKGLGALLAGLGLGGVGADIAGYTPDNVATRSLAAVDRLRRYLGNAPLLPTEEPVSTDEEIAKTLKQIRSKLPEVVHRANVRDVLLGKEPRNKLPPKLSALILSLLRYDGRHDGRDR